MIINHISPELHARESVAVVASSPRLLTTEYGDIIDSFDEVVRFNRATTKCYEGNVGKKCTIRVANNHVFGNVPHTGWETDGQPTNFIREQKNTNIVYLGPGVDDEDSFWKNRDDNVHETSKAFLCDYDILYSSLTDLTGAVRPSAGFSFLWLLITSGFKPHVFGFGLGEEGCSHYWELNAISSHAFTEERGVIQEWTNEGRIVLYR